MTKVEEEIIMECVGVAHRKIPLFDVCVNAGKGTSN